VRLAWSFGHSWTSLDSRTQRYLATKLNCIISRSILPPRSLASSTTGVTLPRTQCSWYAVLSNLHRPYLIAIQIENYGDAFAGGRSKSVGGMSESDDIIPQLLSTATTVRRKTRLG
jgi:hypothetical protein